jgi:hypothetical protein
MLGFALPEIGREPPATVCAPLVVSRRLARWEAYIVLATSVVGLASAIAEFVRLFF